LSIQELPPEEKRKKLKSLLETFIEDEPVLKEDPLYIAILNGIEIADQQDREKSG
jgi:hypothetical protein